MIKSAIQSNIDEIELMITGPARQDGSRQASASSCASGIEALQELQKGEPITWLGHRPFEGVEPFAIVGPARVGL